MALYQLKVSAALAVLRNKPKEADTYTYTKQLCAEYLQCQTRWRSRYLQVQDVLLHLKQQQAVSLSQHERQTRLEGADENIPLMPPSSGPDACNSSQPVQSVTSHHVLMSSYEFINSVVSLAKAVQLRIGKSAGSEITTAERQTDNSDFQASMNSLLAETVPTCVRHLRQAVSKGNTEVSTQCVMQGLDGLLMLLSSDWIDCGSNSPQLQELLEHLGGLVDDLLLRLFEQQNEGGIQCVRTRKLLHQMLLHLTTKLRVPEKYTLLHTLAAHANTLCAALSHDIHRDIVTIPDCYERLAIAVDCLLQGISSLREGELHLESLRELQQKMESALECRLICQFPLVANAIMRLTSMIEVRTKSDDL